MGRWWIAGLAVALVAASSALATTIRRLSLTEVVHQADEIFVGTVQDRRFLSGDPETQVILTEVTFAKLRVLKGDVRTSTLRYRFAGGTLGDRTLSVSGMPKFEDGKRYVLFANATDDWICPAVGWSQGRYTVKTEKSTGQDILCDSDGRPVYLFVNGAPRTKPRREGDRPMRLSTFLKRVSHLVERAKRRQQAPVDQRDGDDLAPDEPEPERGETDAGGGGR